MVGGRGFETEEQGAGPLEVKKQFLKSFPVHSGGERKDLLPLSSYTTGVKLVLGDIDADEQSHTHLPCKKAEKRDCLRPSLHGHEGSKAQSTYQGSRGRGTD